VLSVLVGIATAFGALVFTVVVNAFLKLLMWQLVGYQPPLPGVEGPPRFRVNQFIGGCCSLSPPLVDYCRG